jgi:AcrR family transcriptional regulator
MGRPRSFDEEKALDQAMHVFWEKGFEGASLNDLTKAMGIKPASLYGAFRNKQELFRKALERYRAQQLRFTDDALQEPTGWLVIILKVR